MTSCFHNSQINYMYSLAACFLRSQVQPMYDMVYTKDKIREGFQMAVLCPPRFNLMPVTCPLWSWLFAASVQSFTPLSTAHLTQGKKVMGVLCFFCLKWRKSWQSSFKAPNAHSIIPYHNSASIVESNLQESLLLSKNEISFSSQMMSILVVISEYKLF